MNTKQKLGYTMLGAVIMLVGMSVGSILSPTLIAQNNGVFDEIQCTKLTVVNELGEERIRIDAPGNFASFRMFDGDDTPFSLLHSDNHVYMSLNSDPSSDFASSLDLSATNNGSSIELNMGRHEMDLSCYSDGAFMGLKDTATDQIFFVEFDTTENTPRLVLAEDDTGIVIRSSKKNPGITIADGKSVIGRLPQR